MSTDRKATIYTIDGEIIKYTYGDIDNVYENDPITGIYRYGSYRCSFVVGEKGYDKYRLYYFNNKCEINIHYYDQPYGNLITVTLFDIDDVEPTIKDLMNINDLSDDEILFNVKKLRDFIIKFTDHINSFKYVSSSVKNANVCCNS